MYVAHKDSTIFRIHMKFFIYITLMLFKILYLFIRKS